MEGEAALSVATSAFVRSRVISATQRLLAAEGLGITMSQIAMASGVSRRSLFRHFGNRDALVSAALDETAVAFTDRLRARLDAVAPFSDWLTDLLREVQQSQFDAGRAYWELVASDENALAPQLAAVNRRRIAARRRLTEQVARRAWSLAGGDGPLPDVVLETFALLLSRFAPRSLVEEWGLAPERAVASNVAVLTAVIQAEL